MVLLFTDYAQLGELTEEKGKAKFPQWAAWARPVPADPWPFQALVTSW